MMKRFVRSIFVLAIWAMGGFISLAQTCNDIPVINSFEPNTGFIGSVVEVFGANFDPNNIDNNVVYFGATKAEVVSATFGKLEVIVPVGASTAPISVTNQCNLTAISALSFNGIFCPTPLTAESYDNVTQELAVDYGAYNMLSQDLDLDGRPEVISSSNGGGISVAINNSTPGNLSFTKYEQPNGGGQSIATADFDGDGLKDIVWTYGLNRNISTGPGDVRLANSVNIPGVTSYQIAAGDFNNDGKIDITGIRRVSCGWNSTCYYIAIAFNTSTGPGNISFGPVQYVSGNVGADGNGIQAADIDGDGKTDFIASQRFGNRAVSLRNTTPDGSFSASFEAPEYWSSDSDGINGLGTQPYRSQLADFDKDGKIDFTSCNFSGVTNTAIWRNISTVGDIRFATTVNLPAPIQNYRIQVGDVDGDGYPDIVTKSLGDRVFAVYRNATTQEGNIVFEPRIEYRNSPAAAEVSGIVIGDLDGDFVPDIATSGINSRTIRFHRNTSAQEDTDPPTAIAKDITVALSPQGTVSITAADIDNGSSDACGLDRLEIDIANFTCDDIGENEVELTVYDNAGNSTSATAIVNVQPAAIIVSGQTTVCQGESIPMTANLGDSYQWFRNGVIIAGATQQTYTATETGAYSVAVTNSGGCSGTSLPTEVVVNDNPSVDIFPSGTTYICPPSGTAVLSASQSAIYQWMKDGVDIPNATQQVYTATTIGNYSVRVIDLFGCSAVSDEVTVAANPPEIEVSEGATVITTGSVSGYGDVFPNVNNVKTFTINNTGSNALDVTQILINGADAQYFSIAGGPASVASNASATFDLVFNAPNITSYSASVTIISNDCDEANTTFDVVAEITCVAAAFDNVPSDMAVSTDESTCGAVVSYAVSTSGNPTPDLTYSFTGATTGNGAGTGSGALFGVGTTTVTLAVSNACGSDSQSFTVEVTDDEDPVISGMPANISVDAQDTGCSEVVSWNAPGASDNCDVTLTSSHNSGDSFAVGTTTVTYTATDASGNTVNASFDVTVVPIPLEVSMTAEVLNNVLGYNISCNGAEDGSVDATVSGGCAPYTFSWSNGASSEDADGLGAGSYTLTVTDANGTSVSESISLSEPDPLSVDIAIDPEFPVPTYGDINTIYLGYGDQSATLTASAVGGNNTYYYNWDADASIQDGTTGASIDVTPEESTIYHVTVNDENGCVANQTFTVNVIDIRCLHIERGKGKGKTKGKGNYPTPDIMDKWDGKKVHICHKGKTICISVNAVLDHLTDHDDTLGHCADDVASTAGGTDLANAFEISFNEPLVDLVVSPNPAIMEAVIRFSSEVAGAARLGVVTNKGVHIANLFDGEIAANENVTVRFNTSELADGIYLIRLATPTEVKTLKLMVEK